jgi:hypothetical protein
MIVQSSHDRVHANWTAPLYPALTILAAVATSDSFASSRLARLSRWVTPVGVGLSCLILACFATPLGRDIPLRSPADNVLGWRGLYSSLDAIRRRKGAQWIATTEYGLTGELAFQAKNDVPVHQIVDRQRYTFESIDPAILETTGLLVVSASQEDRLDRYKRCFGKFSPMETIHRHAAGRPIELYFVMAVSNAAPDLLSRGCQLAG